MVCLFGRGVSGFLVTGQNFDSYIMNITNIPKANAYLSAIFLLWQNFINVDTSQ